MDTKRMGVEIAEPGAESRVPGHPGCPANIFHLPMRTSSANLLHALRVSAFHFHLLLIAAPILASCTHTISRDQVMATAHAYTQVRWTPEERHVRHGKDGFGQWVHTPDVTLVEHNGDRRGWWQPGVEATGMPYMWGGFDTPESFQRKLRRGYFAGDVGTVEKVRLLERGVSRRAAGIDCSGFVSRCWGLREAYSTRRLHLVSRRLDGWHELKPGDMLLARGHVMLFSNWSKPGSEIEIYEAGPLPHWKVSRSRYRAASLRDAGYAPWRCKFIRD